MIEYDNLGRSNALLSQEIRDAFERVLTKGWFILGEEVEAFEREFANWCGAKYCVGLASGLDAITLSLRALHLPAGSEVLVPSNAYIAPILSILEANLTPILVEPDLRNYNIDPRLAEKAVTKKTRAIVPVHLYGKISDMKGLTRVAEKYGLKIVEDCAQAHGARYKGRSVGSIGHVGAWSFCQDKIMTTGGEGGMVTTNDEALDFTMFENMFFLAFLCHPVIDERVSSTIKSSSSCETLALASLSHHSQCPLAPLKLI